MRETLSLGPVPGNEDCTPAPYSTQAIAEKARQECQRYIELLRQIYPDMPSGIRLEIELCPYTFSKPDAVGGYYEVAAIYSDRNEEAEQFAFHMENTAPSDWSDTKIRKYETNKDDDEDIDYLSLDFGDEDLIPIVDHAIINSMLVIEGDYLILKNRNSLVIVESIVNANLRGYSLEDPGRSFTIEHDQIEDVILVSEFSQLPK